MSENRRKPIAIVGLGAILPDAPDVPAFWANLQQGRYSIREANAERWDPADYFDPDPKTPDKTYSKIGGWVRDWTWDPIALKLPIPPRVAESMDLTHEGQIKQRIDFLKSNDMAIINESPTEIDEETKLYYRLINAKIITVVKNPETVLLANQETRVQILGYPDSVKKVFKQVDEVLEVGAQKRIESPDPAMVNIEFKATAPTQPYSAYLEAEIYKVAREWQYGEDGVLQQATEDLLNWARSMNFIK